MRVGREPVVRAALQLLDREGLEGFTLRKVAAEIGVQALTSTGGSVTSRTWSTRWRPTCCWTWAPNSP